jgi:hypothetical protein
MEYHQAIGIELAVVLGSLEKLIRGYQLFFDVGLTELVEADD